MAGRAMAGRTRNRQPTGQPEPSNASRCPPGMWEEKFSQKSEFVETGPCSEWATDDNLIVIATASILLGESRTRGRRPKCEEHPKFLRARVG